MSRGRNHLAFTSVRTEGGLLPSETLARIAAGDKDLPGLKAADYHLDKSERIGEAVNRSWSRLLGAWKSFKDELEKLPAADFATGLTRDRWLLPLFSELGYGRLPRSTTTELDGRSFPISHFWHHSPIHLLGCRIQLDRRARGVAGAAQASPHGLVQDFLNRSDDHLWGFVSNGFQLRVLRDHHSLTQQAFVEFDLQAIMEGEQYSDFLLLWMICHQSRVEGARPAECLLEQWFVQSAEEGVRALDALREGVEKAIEHLGAGFLRHPANDALRQALRSGELSAQDYYRELLRLIYRFIFLLVTEDRGLLLVGDDEAAKRRYLEHYSMRRLRELADRARPGRHGDLWHGTRVAMSCLELGCVGLALPALGSLLWRAETCRRLTDCELGNRDLLMAMQRLCFIRRDQRRLPVSWRNMGAEELGSIYEALLELHPTMNLDALAAGAGAGAAFSFDTAAGHERKTTGSYYTPTSLVDCLLDTALDPVIERAAAQLDPESALLALKACDPACGSGHFLIAAARRIAERLAAVRSGEDEPSPEAIRESLRDVISHCIYGVDMNPMAVELCKISLWLEALDPGKPLSFLDHHIRCGNSLLGATPALIERGLPDDAFKPIEGDDPQVCRELKQQNKREQAGSGDLFPAMVADVQADYRVLHSAADRLAEIAEDSVEGVRQKEAAWAVITNSNAYRHANKVADAWCAAFVWPKVRGQPPCPSTGMVRDLNEGSAELNSVVEAKLSELTGEYRFFHWHLEFPDVFQVMKPPFGEHDSLGWVGGFDVVLGNPPWDALSPDTKEFFSKYQPEIRQTARDAQQAIIQELLEDITVSAEWLRYRRYLYGMVHFLRASDRYQMFALGNLGKGDFNIYRMFVELALRFTNQGGRAAQFVPENFYNGANAQAIRAHLFAETSLKCLYAFENTNEVWFKGIHGAAKFAFYVAECPGSTEAFKAAFNIRSIDQLRLAEAGAALTIPVSMVEEFSPDALAVMEFGSQLDITIAAKVYERWPKFGDETAGPPVRHFLREVDMANDRDRFSGGASGLPVFEGRMIAQYDYRAKGYVSGRGRSANWQEFHFGDQNKRIQPQWWIPRELIPRKLGDRPFRYRLGFCDVASPTNERSLVAAIVPPNAICGAKVPTIRFGDDEDWAFIPWLAVANSFVMDFIVRKKVSLSMTFTLMDSLPFPRYRSDDPFVRLVAPDVLGLVCTGPEMVDFWNAMAKRGYVEPVSAEPPRFGIIDAKERLEAGARIDARVAHDVFSLSRTELLHVLSAFPTAEKYEVRLYGEFRSRSLILEYFDKLISCEESNRAATV